MFFSDFYLDSWITSYIKLGSLAEIPEFPMFMVQLGTIDGFTDNRILLTYRPGKIKPHNS